MSIVKIDLSMSSVDRNELYCIIDSTELVNKFDLSDLNKLIEDNDDIWWTGEAEEYFEKELGFVVASSGNTYNNESDLSNILQWSIMMPAAGSTPRNCIIKVSCLFSSIAAAMLAGIMARLRYINGMVRTTSFFLNLVLDGTWRI